MTPPVLARLFMATFIATGAAAAEPRTPDAIGAWAQARVAAKEAGAIVVARVDGATVTLQGFGHRTWPDGPAPDGDTRFLTGSVGKVFTHLLLAERVAAGAVRYGQALGTLLPEGVTPHNPAVADITLETLASHRSGLPRLPPNFVPGDPADPYADFNEAALWNGVRQTRVGQPLGHYYGYSNFGVGLLGHLLGREAGSDYFAALDEHIIEPLGMDNTGKDAGDNHAVAVSGGRPATAWSNHDALAGAGGLWGSGNDLARLLQAYLGHHEHSLKHDLEADLEIVGDEEEGMSVTRVWHVARAGGQPIYWHNGGTVTHWSFAGFRPDTGQGVVVLTSGDADPTAVALAALGHTDADADAAAAAEPVDTALAGQYQLGDGGFGIGVFERGGRLFAQGSGQPALPLHPVGEDWYAMHEVDASLRFIRDADADADAVTGIEFVQAGISQDGERVGDAATVGQHTEVELPADAFAQYEGRYALASGAEFSIREREGGLEAMLTGQTWLPIHAAGDDLFFYRVVDATLHFGRDADGKVDALTLRQGHITQQANRVDEDD